MYFYDQPRDVSMRRMMKLNASEWPFIFLGCLFAVIHGGAQPLFGIVFGGFIGVSSNNPLMFTERIP